LNATYNPDDCKSHADPITFYRYAFQFLVGELLTVAWQAELVIDEHSTGIEDGRDQCMNPPLRERLGPELQQRADGGFAVAMTRFSNRCGANFTSVGASPCSWSHRQNAFSARTHVLAGDRTNATFAQVNNEPLKVGLGDGRCVGRTLCRRCILERLPRALIPLTRRVSDVVDVGSFAEKLLKELIESIHGASGSFPT